jgi:hypothetical protein
MPVCVTDRYEEQPYPRGEHEADEVAMQMSDGLIECTKSLR